MPESTPTADTTQPMTTTNDSRSVVDQDGVIAAKDVRFIPREA